ncbi:MAG: hypothetical protein ABII39_05615 [Candidatus Micrarchaeota archaeon]
MSETWLVGIYADVEEIRKVPGSKNKKLVDSVIKKFNKEIKKENKWISEWNNDEPNTIQKAILEIVEGRFGGGQYGYMAAFQYVCKFLGTPTKETDIYPNPETLPKRFKAVKLNLLARKWRDLLKNNGLKVKLPKKDEAIWPVTTVISSKELVKIKKEIINADLAAFDEDEKQAIDSINKIIDTAIKKKKDLLLFLSRG